MGSTPAKKLLLIDTDPGIGAPFAHPTPFSMHGNPPALSLRQKKQRFCRCLLRAAVAITVLQMLKFRTTP